MEIRKIEKNRPKIILLVDTWFPYDDGRPTYIARLAEYLVTEEGYSVEILTRNIRGTLRAHEKELEAMNHLTIRRLGPPSSAKNWAARLGYGGLLFWILLNRRDSLLTHAHGVISAFSSKWASLFTGVPTVVTVHGHQMLGSRWTLKKWIQQVMFLETRYGQEISVSESLLQLKNVNEPVFVIPPGIDLAEFPAVSRAREPQSFCALYVGPLEWEKGVDLLLEAVRRTVESHEFIQSKKDLLVQIVGEGSEEKFLKEKVKEFTLSRHVQFLKRPSSAEDLAALYQGADVFVLPSRSDALPIPLLEACASGLPILATDTGDHSRLVLPNVNGILVRPDDSAELADALSQFVLNPHLREWGQASRSLVENEFSWDNCLRKNLRVYERVGFQKPERRLGWRHLPQILMKRRAMTKLYPGKKALQLALTVNVEQAPGSRELPEEDTHVQAFIEQFKSFAETWDLKATLFFEADFFEPHAQLIAGLAAAGHEIALKGVDTDWESIPARRKSLRRLRDEMNRLGMNQVMMFRPPVEPSEAELSDLHEYGFEYIPVSEDPLPTIRWSWKGPYGQPVEMKLEEWLEQDDDETLESVNRLRSEERTHGLDPYLIFECNSFDFSSVEGLSYASGENFSQLSRRLSFLKDQMDLEFVTLSGFLKGFRA